MSTVSQSISPEYFDKYVGKSIDLSGLCGAQSPDLAIQYILDITGVEVSKGNGSDFWLHPELEGSFTPISRKEDPQTGDIASWSGQFGAYSNGGYGHVAVYVFSKDGVRYFLTQNPGPARIQPLSSVGIQGWMRPQETKPTNLDGVNKENKMSDLNKAGIGFQNTEDISEGYLWSIIEGYTKALQRAGLLSTDLRGPKVDFVDNGQPYKSVSVYFEFPKEKLQASAIEYKNRMQEVLKQDWNEPEWPELGTQD